MATHDIIVIGASAGGIEPLLHIVAKFPPDIPAAVFITVHIPANFPSNLPQIVRRAGTLPASHVDAARPIENGHIYIASPDRHLMLTAGRVHSIYGPRENRHRPAIDALFRSAALAYGPRVVGIVLSGALDDGTAGLIAIKRRGGVAIVQDPSDALFPDMPTNAHDYVEIDHSLPAREIAPLLMTLAQTPAAEEGAFPVPEDMQKESDLTGLDLDAIERGEHVGTLSGYMCPECHGPLWEIQDAALTRFRCRVGHSYTAETMIDAQSEEVEDALWMALNTLEESAQVAARLADDAQKRKHPQVARRFIERAQVAQQRAQTIKRLLLNLKNTNSA